MFKCIFKSLIVTTFRSKNTPTIDAFRAVVDVPSLSVFFKAKLDRAFSKLNDV